MPEIEHYLIGGEAFQERPVVLCTICAGHQFQVRIFAQQMVHFLMDLFFGTFLSLFWWAANVTVLYLVALIVMKGDYAAGRLSLPCIFNDLISVHLGIHAHHGSRQWMYEP